MRSGQTYPADRVSERPLSIDELNRMPYEPPSAPQPAAMRSFLGLDGIVLSGETKAEEFKVGFTRLDTGGNGTSWALSATHAFRFGLPVLDRRVIPRGEAPAEVRSTPEPLHHSWNARYFNPVVGAIAERVARTSRGKRAVFTDIDALIFNTDDRKPYYPNAYPWHCIGRLETDSGSSKGSAALVGRDLILTARHVVQAVPAPAPLKFVPAYYEGGSTIAPSFFSWVKSETFYEGSEPGAWDFALLRLYQPLGDHLGYFGVRTYNDDWDDLHVWAAAGYPAMAPFDSQRPSFLLGVSVDDAIEDGDATELESEDQDNSKGNSGGPLWAVWSNGPSIVGVTSANQGTDYGPFGSDYQVLNASGRAMVNLVGLARLEIDTTIHVNPPKLNLGG
jgi:hypothetical protein